MCCSAIPPSVLDLPDEVAVSVLVSGVCLEQLAEVSYLLAADTLGKADRAFL